MVPKHEKRKFHRGARPIQVPDPAKTELGINQANAKVIEQWGGTLPPQEKERGDTKTDPREFKTSTLGSLNRTTDDGFAEGRLAR